MTDYNIELASTALSSASYDDETQDLEITFVSGASYTFPNVPLGVFEGLRDARSPGAYYNQRIKGIFG